MNVTDLQPGQENLYCLCLEEWSDEIREAGDIKYRWFEEAKKKGIRVKLAIDDNGAGAGMIHYMPIENTHVKGEGLYFIYCIWVHGYKEGQGNYQKRGVGTALLEAAEQDARELGAKGMAAWGVAVPFFMRAAWFKKKGYKACDRDGISVLLWKPFAGDAVAPEWNRRKKSPHPTPGQVVFKEYHTSETEVFHEWGILDALYIDGKKVRTGPPPSYEKILKLVRKAMRKKRQ